MRKKRVVGKWKRKRVVFLDMGEALPLSVSVPEISKPPLVVFPPTGDEDDWEDDEIHEPEDEPEQDEVVALSDERIELFDPVQHVATMEGERIHALMLDGGYLEIPTLDEITVAVRDGILALNQGNPDTYPASGVAIIQAIALPQVLPAIYDKLHLAPLPQRGTASGVDDIDC